MFLSPYQVVGHLPVKPGMRVADFGAGNGDYSFLVHDQLKGEGVMYAFEFNPEQVERLHREANRRYCEQFYSVCTDLNDIVPLRDDVIHVALVVNTLHQLKERNTFLSELNRILKREGSVLFVDWASDFKNMGPTSEHVITPGDAVRLFRAHGFTVGSMLPAGTHHYAFIATKQ